MPCLVPNVADDFNGRKYRQCLVSLVLMFTAVWGVAPENGICQESENKTTANHSIENDASTQESPHNDANQKRDRLVMVGFGVGAMLALLGVVFVYLRLNHATRGFYSGRLQSIAFACFVAILVVCYFLWAEILFQ